MGRVKVYHYRDHHNGGKFDGVNCYVATLNALSTYNYAGMWIRFKAEDPINTNTCLWGVGRDTSNDQWALKIHRASGNYYFRVRYLDVDYDFTYEIEIGKIYEVLVRHIGGYNGDVVIEVWDQYHNLLFEDQQTNTSDPHYSLSTNNIFIGATSWAALTAGELYKGYIYDFYTLFTSTSDILRLVFYENYGGLISNWVAKNTWGSIAIGAAVMNITSDFWPDKTDISDYITDEAGGFSDIRYSQDQYRVPVFESTNFGLCTKDWDEIQVGDSIEIEIDSKTSWLFNVKKIEERNYSIKTIYLEDIFSQLINITAINIFAYYYNYFAIGDAHWWSNYVPNTSSYAEKEYYWDPTTERRRWFNIFYVLQLVFYMLQYDNILTISIGTIKDNNSDYLYNDSPILYKYLAFNQLVSTYLGQSASTDTYSSAKADKVFREILKCARLTYYVNTGILKYYKVSYDNESVDDDDKYDYATEEIENKKYYQVIANFLDDGADKPDWPAYASAFTSGDIDTITKNNLDSVNEITNPDLIETITLLKHFFIGRHFSTSDDFREISYGSTNDDFLDQLADIFDAELRNKFNREAIKTSLLPEVDEKYYRKIDDLENLTTEIKQEV